MAQPRVGLRRGGRESITSKQQRAGEILRHLRQFHGPVECALVHEDPLELLVATILSAQCTDERVNQVTRSLFRKYRSAASYAAAPPGTLEEEIRSTGFYRNKAKSIRGACARIVSHHHGKVPDTMEELLELAGVARKTANVVLGVAFGKAEGVVVDTHVQRLSGRLGLTASKDPVKIERDLMKIFPREDWIDLAHLLIWHGRRVCTARKPDCPGCPVLDLCPQRGVTGSRGVGVKA